MVQNQKVYSWILITAKLSRQNQQFLFVKLLRQMLITCDFNMQTYWSVYPNAIPPIWLKFGTINYSFNQSMVQKSMVISTKLQSH